MSTILDALRKVEQDHRAQNTDVRVRLLTLPPRPHPRAPQKKLLPWTIRLGLVVVGFLIGVGTMYGPALMITSDSSSALLEPVETVTNSTPNKPAAALVAEDTPLAEPSAQPFVPTPSQEQSTPALPPVQRSPFLSPPPSDLADLADLAEPAKSTASPSLPQYEYIIEPLPQDLWTDEALPPEDEAHFVSPSAQPPPISAPVLSPGPAARLDASLGLLQWSPEAAQRIAFIRVADGPLSMVYEGDSVGGFTVVEIHKDRVDLRSNDADGASLTLRLR